MLLRLFVIVTWCALPQLLHAQGVETMVQGGMSRIAQDGQGTVWGMIKGERRAIHVLDGASWQFRSMADLPPLSGAVAMERLADGHVACLWKDDRDEVNAWVLSLHRGTGSRVTHGFHADLVNPALHGASDGRVFITGSGRTCVSISSADMSHEVITLPEKFFLPPDQKAHGTLAIDHAPLRALVDGAGTAWLWSPGMLRQPAQWRLAGLVKMGQQAQDLRLCPIMDDAPMLSAVVPWDAERLLVAVAGVGPFLFNTGSLKLEPMPVPDASAFRYIEQFFHDGAAWHAVTVPRPTEVTPPRQFGDPISEQFFYDRSKPVCDLWRHDGGSWKRILEGLDKDPAKDRPWLRTSTGLFIASDTGPPWFLPREGGEARRLSASVTFPLPEVRQMVAVSDGALLLTSAPPGVACLWPAIEPIVDARSRHVQKLTAIAPALVDAQGRIWMFQDAQTFLRWDGQEWRAFPLPVTSLTPRRSEKPALSYGMPNWVQFVPDNRNRGWLLPPHNGQVAICDFATGRWHEFPDYRAALVAQLPSAAERKASVDQGRPLHREPLVLNFPGHNFSQTTFSTDGRIAFATLLDVMLYEGNHWQEWKANDIIPYTRVSGPFTVFFAPNGRFCMAKGDVVLQWHSKEERWEPADGIAAPSPRLKPGGEPQKIWRLPDGRELDQSSVATAARDNQGVIWKVENDGRIVKMVPGRTVSICEPGPFNPFRTASAMHTVFVDPSGSALLNSPSGPHRYFFIPSKHPAPQSAARLFRVEEDTVHLALGAEGASAWHMWRLDGGEWQPLIEGPSLALEALAPGRHTVEVRAFNAELTPAGATVTVTFETTVSTGKEFASQLRDLASPDLDTREAAARKLKSQGVAVLPRLRAARESASPDVQWWIDAIIQHIERHSVE